MLLLLVGFRVYFYKHFISEGLAYFTRSNFEFSILLLVVGIISNAGYLVNDILDVEADKINKPNKKLPYSKNTLWIIYSFMNIFSAILIVLFLENSFIKAILFATIILLYLYSLVFQKIILIGNFTIAFLSGILPFVYLVFEGLDRDDNCNLAMTSVVLFYAVIAFLITFLREVVKDKEDEKGDELVGCKTFSNTVSEVFFKIITTSYLVVSLVLIHLFIKDMNVGVYSGSNKYFWIICSLFYLSSAYYLLKSNYKTTSTILKTTLFIGVLFLFLL